MDLVSSNEGKNVYFMSGEAAHDIHVYIFSLHDNKN